MAIADTHLQYYNSNSINASDIFTKPPQMSCKSKIKPNHPIQQINKPSLQMQSEQLKNHSESHKKRQEGEEVGEGEQNYENEEFEPLQESIEVRNKSHLGGKGNLVGRKSEGDGLEDGNQFIEGEERGGIRYENVAEDGQAEDASRNNSKLSQKQSPKKSNPDQQAPSKPIPQKQQDRESRIKNTIQRITKNILFSKQSIVEDITSINNYYQENEKEIHHQLREGTKIKMAELYASRAEDGGEGKKKGGQERARREEERVERPIRMQIVEKLRGNRQEDKLIKQKQIQRKRNKQIYQQQKQARKQQQMLEKHQSRLKKNELEKRIIYEQKFISRRSGSPEIPISAEEIKAFEDAFIQQIKERLNIGKVKNRGRSLQEQNEIRRAKAEEQRKNYNKKMHKGQKLKEKILMNIKQKIQQELQPTYSSILADSHQLQNPATPQRKRTHQSAPQFKLPPVLSPTKPLRRTFHSKQKINQQRVHILKLSNAKG